MASSRPVIRALLLDLSGTLHVGSSPTPGAIEALHRLRSAQIPFRFCSNTSKESTSVLSDRLEHIGFDINPYHDEQEIWTSIGAVKRFLVERGLKKPYFLLSESARKECSSHMEPMPEEAPYDSVVVGLSPPHFTYDTLNTAFRVLKGEQHNSVVSSPASHPPLIATHKAKYIGASDGRLSLGPGPFVSALETATGVQAVIVGKPTRTFFELVIGSLGPNEESGSSEDFERKIAIIGDDVEADLGGGALELGLWRVLVKTGKYRPGDETKTDVPPDEVFDSFAAFVDDLLAGVASG